MNTTKDSQPLGLGLSEVLGPNAPHRETVPDEVARLVAKCNSYIVDNARLAEMAAQMRSALEDAEKVLLQLVPYSACDEDMAHMEQLRTSALNSVRWALGPNAPVKRTPQP